MLFSLRNTLVALTHTIESTGNNMNVIKVTKLSPEITGFIYHEYSFSAT